MSPWKRHYTWLYCRGINSRLVFNVSHQDRDLHSVQGHYLIRSKHKFFFLLNIYTEFQCNFTRQCWHVGLGRWASSVQTNTINLSTLISPSSRTPACSTSAESELYLFVPFALGQDCELESVDHQHWHPPSWQPQLSANQGCLPPPVLWCHSFSRCQTNNHQRAWYAHSCACVVDVCEFHMSG